MKTPEQIAKRKEYIIAWRQRTKNKRLKKAKEKYWENPQIHRERVRAKTDEQKQQRNAKQRARYKIHREKYLEANKKSWMKRSPEERVRVKKIYHLNKYGMTLEEYEAMVTLSHGQCSICRRDMLGVGCGKMCIDHDHKTGKVRGLLCNECNVGLGQFRDNIECLLSAIEYLRRHSPE